MQMKMSFMVLAIWLCGFGKVFLKEFVRILYNRTSAMLNSRMNLDF